MVQVNAEFSWWGSHLCSGCTSMLAHVFTHGRFKKMLPSRLEQARFILGYFLTIDCEITRVEDPICVSLYVHCVSHLLSFHKTLCVAQCPSSPPIRPLLLYTLGIPCCQELGHKMTCSRTVRLGSSFQEWSRLIQPGVRLEFSLPRLSFATSERWAAKI